MRVERGLPGANRGAPTDLWGPYQASKFYGVPLWEMLDQPVIYLTVAEVFAQAENMAQEQLSPEE